MMTTCKCYIQIQLHDGLISLPEIKIILSHQQFKFIKTIFVITIFGLSKLSYLARFLSILQNLNSFDSYNSYDDKLFARQSYGWVSLSRMVMEIA